HAHQGLGAGVLLLFAHGALRPASAAVPNRPWRVRNGLLERPVPAPGLAAKPFPRRHGSFPDSGRLPELNIPRQTWDQALRHVLAPSVPPSNFGPEDKLAP